MAKKLERSLGFWSVFSISVGAMIGSGIFVLPGLAAGKAGPAVVLAYFIAGIIVVPAALSKAELATGIPVSGGTYIYLDRSMGPFVGTVGGLGTWFALFFKSAFALVGLGAYLTIFLSLPTKYVAFVLCVGLIGLNITGVKKTARLQMGIIFCVFIALTVFMGKGFRQLNTGLFTPFTIHGWMGVIKATGFVFISYAGVTKIASIVEEVKHPERNIPLGILASLSVMIIVYTLIVCVLIGTIPIGELLVSPDTGKPDLTPIASAAGKMFGEAGRYLWAIVAVLALTSMANAGLLSSSRYPFAMSRDNLLPGFLRFVHARFRTPLAAILLTGGLMLLLIAFVDVEKLAKLASAFQILVFSLVNLSVIIFRESHVEWYKPRFRSPGYPWVQLLGIGMPLLLLFNLGTLPIIGVATIFVGGALWYFLYARTRVDRIGSLAQTREHVRQLREIAGGTGNSSDKKKILVPFYGDESEPEIESRIRIAMIFSLPDGLVHPVYFDEIPDETLLEAIRDTDQDTQSFEDRFRYATRQWAQNLTLDIVATHDAKLASFRYASSLDARWILMGKRRKSFWNFLIRAHKHWWLHHSPSSVTQFIYRDLREIQRIAVMTEPGPYDALLLHVADRLATVFDAETILFHVANEDAPDSDIERVQEYHDELRGFFRREVESQIIRGRKRLDTAIAETKNFDLLILGAPAEDRLLRIVTRSFEDQLAERAACSVFLVQSPRSYSHEAATAVPESIQTEGFRLFPFLHQGIVEARITIKNKADFFSYISVRFSEESKTVSAADLEQAFWDRERVQNTAMGHGVAMPHAAVSNFERTLLSIFTLHQPIDFESPDASQVDLCFVTVGPAEQRSIHLKILGRIAALIRETDLAARMREAETNAQLIDALLSVDS